MPAARSVCFVVAPDHAAIRELLRRRRAARRACDLTTRCSRSPTAPPARCRARSAFAGRDPFLVLNSDNLYPAAVLRALVELDGPGLPAYRARLARARQRLSAPIASTGFAAIEVDDRGHLHAHRRETGPRLLRRGRTARARQHERVALRRADLRRVPRRAAVGARRIRTARGRGPGRSTRGVRFRTFPRDAAPCSICRAARDVALVSARLAGVEARP